MSLARWRATSNILFVLAALSLAACGGSARAENRRGNTLYAQEDYAGALAAYETARVADRALIEVAYNLGNTQFRLQENEIAQRSLDEAVQASLAAGDHELAQQAWYNLGDMRFAAEDFGGAVEAFKAALRLKPDDVDAKVNLELALQRLQENEEPRDEEQDEEQQGEQEDENQEQPQQPDESGEGEMTATPTPQPPDAATPTPQSTAEPTSEPTAQPTAGTTPQPTPAAPAAAPPGSSGDLPPALPGELTELDARRILEAAASGTQTLQEYLQRGFAFPNDVTEKDW